MQKRLTLVENMNLTEDNDRLRQENSVQRHRILGLENLLATSLEEARLRKKHVDLEEAWKKYKFLAALYK